MTDFDIITVGAINIDYSLNKTDTPFLNMPATGKDVEVEIDEFQARGWLDDLGLSDHETDPGGSAFNTARAIVALRSKLNVGFVGAVGLLEDGSRFPQEMKVANIVDDLVKTVDSSRPGACFNYIDGVDRHLFTCPFGNLEISSHLDHLCNLIAERQLLVPKIVHVTSLFDGKMAEKDSSPSRSLARFVECVKEHSPESSISFDPGSHWLLHYPNAVKAIQSKTDVLFLNRYEFGLLAKQHYRNEPSEQAAKTILSNMQNTASIVVLKLPGEIYCFESIDGEITKHVFEGKKLSGDETNNPAGAGDALAGGYLAGKALGFDLERSVNLGRKMAICKITAPNGLAAEMKYHEFLKETEEEILADKLHGRSGAGSNIENQRPIVFISYAHSESKIASRLAREFERRGSKVFIDEKNIEVGDSISKTIEQGITSCDYFCLVISDASANRPWVDLEYRTALKINLDSGGAKPVIIPILAENCGVPTFLLDTKNVNLGDNFERGFDLIVSAINSSGGDKHRALRATPPAFADLPEIGSGQFLNRLRAGGEQARNLPEPQGGGIFGSLQNGVSTVRDELGSLRDAYKIFVDPQSFRDRDVNDPDIAILVFDELNARQHVNLTYSDEVDVTHSFGGPLLDFIGAVDEHQTSIRARTVYVIPKRLVIGTDGSYPDGAGGTSVYEFVRNDKLVL